MDCVKMGKLILDLRREKNMTQKQVADALHLSDKTISKWERGLGCPDISLLGRLSEIFDVSIEKILAGDLQPQPLDLGNMKKLKFYVCPNCGNILAGTGGAEISCCGRKLMPLLARPADADHQPIITKEADEFYITFDHEMSKEHFLVFVAFVSYDRFLLVRLYPEQNAEVRFPRIGSGRFFFCCNRHGLWEAK